MPSISVSAWAVCWAVKPTKNLINFLQVRRTAQWQAVQERMKHSRISQSVLQSRYLSSKTGTELAVAFGVSYFLRKLGIPVLVPLKLWLTYELVVRTEERSGEAVEAEGA